MRSKGGFMAMAILFFVLIISGCGGGGGGDSSPAVPAAPTGVTATAGDGSASIGWTAVAGATSYNIYYSTTTGVPKATATKIAGVTTSPRVVTPLINGTTYYFVVTAVDANGESADSSQVSATPTLATPAAPTGVTATPGHGEVTISWDNVAGAASYNIYFDNTTGVTKVTGDKLTGVTSPRVVTPLTNGTTYYFVVTAVNAAGESVESSQVSATPTPNLPPAPTGVAAAAGPGQATINWTAVAGATSYNIYHSLATGVTKSTGTKITGVTSPGIVPGLIRGVPYYFVATAVNADGEGVESAQVSATPNAPAPNFSQADLEGTWEVRVILSGTESGWYGVKESVTNTGVVTSLGVAGPAIPPTVSALSITTGTGASAGTVTETGASHNATFHGKMSWNKNLIVGTSTRAAGAFALHIFVKKVPGVVFSNADLADKTFVSHRIYTGTSHAFERAEGAVNSSGITVTAEGLVSIASEITFSGVLSPDKKIIVGASTDNTGKYSLRTILMRGQTYSLADLAGTNGAYAFISTPASSWTHATWSTDLTGNVTFVDILDSNGSTTLPAPFTTTLDAQGNSSGGGMLSFGKDLLVSNGSLTDGSFVEIKVQ